MAAKLIGERLPPNWSFAVTRDGRIFFIDDNSHRTTWLHPMTGQPVQTGHSNTTDLPPGWEQALSVEGAVYYIDHNNQLTTFENPAGGSPVMDSPLRSPIQGQGFKQGPARKSQKSKTIKAPSASRGENSKVILRGWLSKQESGGLKLWKKKWCVLADFGLFFYKDDGEQNCIGSILLPSYKIDPCNPAHVHKKFAFKAEHDNMKTFFFAADSQPEMERWLEALRMASLVQKAPQAGFGPKLIPKSPIMSWTDNIDSPGVAPPDMQQYPFSSPEGDTPRTQSDTSFRDRSPHQAHDNTHNHHLNIPGDFANRSYSQDPRDEQGSMRGSQRSSQHGSQRGSYDPRDNYRQGHRPSDPNRSFDPRFPQDRDDSTRGSTRSSQDRRSKPEDPRSRTSAGQRPGQYSSRTLPRDSRPHPAQNQHRSQTLPHQGQGQGYNSLPRDSRSRLAPEDMDRPFGHSSPRQTLERQMKGADPRDRPRKEDNPYMMMSSPLNQHANERRMDPSKHSNRPLPQEPPPEIRHERERSGGGDYASLTRYKNKWPNQNLAQPDERSPPSQQPHPGMVQNQPDLYVDIPHTYVNVYDESQVREGAPDLPMRPPLPVEMRPMIVRDIADSHSPNTRHEMIQAENNLELRMLQPPVFNYPTPTRESLPAFPQESPRSQRSQRSQRSTDPRSGYHDDARSPQLPPRRPDLAPLSSPDGEMMSHEEAQDSYNSPPSSGSYRVSHTMDGSDNTLTNEDRNEKINEFYRLGKYNGKNMSQQDKNRIMSELDVNSRSLPRKPMTGVGGEKDFRLRSLPDHVQSMPAIYHEKEPLSIVVPERDTVVNSHMNLANPNAPGEGFMPTTNGYGDPPPRKSAFRPLAGSSSSLQRYPGDPIQKHGHPEDYSKHPGYPDQDQTEVKRLSSASSQLSQPRQSRKPDGFPGPLGEGHVKGQGQRGPRSVPGIHTVREEPDMPDSQVIETDLPKRVFPLSGPRLRMSISATDLLGKTHDELVLLLIQLRRDKSELNTQRDGVRKNIEQHRPMEIYYRKLQNEGRPVDREKEAQHHIYMEMKRDLEEVEKKLEVYKPLVNLVCNMVTMGSLYGGDNFMLATEYRKHLLSPEQYSPPKKMLEFSRQHQEHQIVQEIEEDVRQLTREQADLEEKLDRLYELDRIMQEQSFQVTSLKEDREMLERALGGLLKKQDQNCTNPRELDKLIGQQRTIEKELSRVLQQLAESSRELEETTAENNKIEHEVALLRSKVHGNVSRSKSAPSLTSESLHTKMKMEKDLAKVRNIMEGLSEQGARLHEVMSNLRQGKSPDNKPSTPTRKGPELKTKQGKSTETYYETDLDTSQSKDLAQVTALLASYQLGPHQQGRGDLSPEPLSNRTTVPVYSSPPQSQPDEGGSAFRTVSPGRREVEPVFHAMPIQPVQQHHTQSAPEVHIETDGDDQWDIGDADDNTKRYFDTYNYSGDFPWTGLIPKNMPKSQTVRDVKRNSEHRREGKKKEDDPPPLRVGVIPSNTDYTDSNFHVYENLPQQKSAPATETTIKPAWASVALEADTPSSSERRRSALHLVTPKPFSLNSKPTPFSSVSSVAPPVSNHGDSPPSKTFQSQLYNGGSSITSMDYSGLNDTPTPTAEPIVSVSPTKTPPPPPVRGTSRIVTAEVSKHKFASLPHLASTTGQSSSGRNYVQPIPTILKKGRNNRDKARYMTISSSQPVKLEANVQQSPKQHSQAGDLISSMEVPDIVKSSTTKIDQFDERTIDREILFFPQKVEIPERYMPDSDEEENLTEEEKAQRREKAAKIKKILTQQSVHSLSQPDVSKVAGEVHERVQQEKRLRAQLLGINQQLAEQVKRKSRQFAAERRKTWSGTPHKSESSDGEERSREAEDPSDANNNSYSSDRYTHQEQYAGDQQYAKDDNSYYQKNPYTRGDHSDHQYAKEDNSFQESSYTRGDYSDHQYAKEDNSYQENSYLRGDHSDHQYAKEDNSYYQDNSYSRGDNPDNSFMDRHYNSTSYADRPNFKI